MSPITDNHEERVIESCKKYRELASELAAARASDVLRLGLVRCVRRADVTRVNPANTRKYGRFEVPKTKAL